MTLLEKNARIAGFLYLLDVLIAPFRLAYIPSKLVVSGNAAATAGNILAHEMMFRLGIASDLSCGVLEVFMLLALYRLFKDVDTKQAIFMVALGLWTTAIFFFNVLNDAAALTLLKGPDFLAAFNEAQRQGLAMLFLNLHHWAILGADVIFGLWLFPLAVLVLRSGFLPRFLGGWLIVNGFAYLALSVSGILLPQYEDMVAGAVVPAQLGEVAFMLWLLIRGAKLPTTTPAGTLVRT